MIPMDLLGVLLRALDLNKVSRLILVGDPNQLPPIGPGRPFVDLITWLDADQDRRRCLARPPGEPLEDVEEDRGEEDAEQRHPQHAAEDG